MLNVIAVTECGNLTYQWFKNRIELTDGVKYSGVENNSLTVTDLVYPDDEGTFMVKVTNKAGTTTSANATLDICKCNED